MRRIAIFAVCISVILIRIPAAQAQKISVQQPSLETFGVATTVSVPDRGGLYVGGSGRAAAARSMYGPLRTGTNLGTSARAGGLAVSAYVHDLDESDRQILAAAGRTRTSRNESVLSPEAARAYATLQSNGTARNFAQSPPGRDAVDSQPRSTSPAELAKIGPSAERLLDRARAAESNGKRELALAYLRSARDLGSNEARVEIARLSLKRR
ncbi:MAG: hypothetical protein HY290_13865 [Planctomycetia bacterium]|nr:hypothetical protein [Planctomycetia bacterium]